MISPKIPNNEFIRLQELYSYKILDSLEEEDYDFITLLAAQICNSKYALITLIDSDRQWFKSKCGIDINETPRELSFCGHAIYENKDIYIVEDARNDIHFHDNPFVVQEPHIVFYAGVPLRSDDNLPLGTLCVFHDDTILLNQDQITALKALARQVMNIMQLRKSTIKLEEQAQLLKNKNENLEDFFKAFKDLIVITDRAFEILKVNESWIEDYEQHNSEVKATNWFHYIHETDKKFIESIFDKTPNTNEVETFLCRIKDNKGFYREVKWRVYYLDNKYYLYGRDRTDQNNKETNLLKLLNLSKVQNERLQNFAHIVSHNLRSHSSNISALIHLIGEKYPVKDNEFFKMLLLASENMIETTNHLSEVALLYNAGKDELKQIPLKQVIARALDIFQLELIQNNFEVKLVCKEQIVVLGYAEYLDSVFQNLISNTIKYARTNVQKQLFIEAKDEGDYINVSFEDNGLGIDLERNKDKIFGMYKTFHFTENARGLGLFITKNQMEGMGGWIEVKSKVNEGTKFNLFFKKPYA